MSIPYRADIDGLRAIAVIAVLLFHAKLAGFSGGFAGVDVFFVISGYLITSLIKKEIEAGSFSIRQFYCRRIRRLSPSLIVVLLFSWCAGFMLFNDVQFVEFGKTLGASAAFVSNWYFLANSNYFDAALETNSLLHTWSLSIEEQYYLVWPLALMVMHRFSKRWPYIQTFCVVLLITCSFIFSVWLVRHSQEQMAFFNTFGRFWELLIGALIAVNSVNGARLPNIAKIALRLFGLTCIISSFFIYDKNTGFPGFAALLPVLGTALVLLVDNSGGPIYRFLTIAPMRFVGKISYSLYLWHWPLLVYANIIWPQRSWFETVIILLVSIILATATTYLIENPIRYKRILSTNKLILSFGGATTAALALVATITVLSHGVPQRWEYKNIDLRSVHYSFREAYHVGTCFIDNRHKVADLLTAKCLEPQADSNNVLIIGDSFAAHLMPGLEHHFPDIHFNQGTATACRGLYDFPSKRDHGDWPCPELNHLLFDEFIEKAEYDAILLVSDWQYGRKGRGDGPRLLMTIDYIKSKTDTPIVVLGNSPVYINSTDIALRSHIFLNKAVNTKLDFRPKLLDMDAYSKKNIKRAKFISLIDNFCPDLKCPIVTGAGKMVHSGTHLTEWGAIDIIGSSKQDIRRALSQVR